MKEKHTTSFHGDILVGTGHVLNGEEWVAGEDTQIWVGAVSLSLPPMDAF